MWCWKRVEKTKWSERITNEEFLERIGKKRKLLNNILEKNPIGLAIFQEENAFIMTSLKERWQK